jgi:hypothetical protein
MSGTKMNEFTPSQFTVARGSIIAIQDFLTISARKFRDANDKQNVSIGFYNPSQRDLAFSTICGSRQSHLTLPISCWSTYNTQIISFYLDLQPASDFQEKK